nr:hypothetical protein [uncultured Mediterranean phage uvMED]
MNNQNMIIRSEMKHFDKLFKDLVKAGIFMNDKNGVTAFAKLLIQLNTKYPGWRQPK